MATITKIDNVSNMNCNGSHFYLVYEGTEYIAHGQQNGQVTSGRGTIEYFNTEEEVLSRADELNVTIPLEI